MSDLHERICEMLTGGSGRKKWTFTLEHGRGETYRTSDPTLYGHSTYERSSVLAGREQRVFIHRWPAGEESLARTELAEIRKVLPMFRYEDLVTSCGSTHVPIAELVSHLPDDTDY